MSLKYKAHKVKDKDGNEMICYLHEDVQASVNLLCKHISEDGFLGEDMEQDLLE